MGRPTRHPDSPMAPQALSTPAPHRGPTPADSEGHYQWGTGRSEGIMEGTGQSGGCGVGSCSWHLRFAWTTRPA
eukprot:4150137-Alexandrium_andersonii.AAC.1